ncbi:cytochrome c biogenesis protein ResB [Nocardioides sp. SOB77]|uniref:Cytochrome c biogenesis protein ResB n=1 Tax=Nocardioides oceani TaxID=3058369 RepID=A0ABT8FMC5_9ACTN|nr:cytochrome c biogenesis protein ResB [Nocardioides oceani]MDN4175784.1 cytochrome c biogenesis protein ResB [Nocardioides oceani]
MRGEPQFLPTYGPARNGGSRSTHPNLLDPVLEMTAYAGDLNLNDGAPQSVFVLSTTDAEQVRDGTGNPLTLTLRPGQTRQLPDGLGSIRFDGIEPWTRLQISTSPGDPIVLGGVLAALLGVTASLFVRPRRIWVRPMPGADAHLELGALARGGGGDLTREIDRLLRDLDVIQSGPIYERGDVGPARSSATDIDRDSRQRHASGSQQPHPNGPPHNHGGRAAAAPVRNSEHDLHSRDDNR